LIVYLLDGAMYDLGIVEQIDKAGVGVQTGRLQVTILPCRD
jgi:hypothetical protein